MKKMVRSVLSCILVLTMILALIPSVSLSAWAEDSSSGQNEERTKSFSDMIYDEFIKSQYTGYAKEKIREAVVDFVYRSVAQKDVPGASESFKALMNYPPPSQLTYKGLDKATINNWSIGIKYVINISNDVSKVVDGVNDLIINNKNPNKYDLSLALSDTLEGFLSIADSTIGLLLPKPVSTVVTVPIKVGKVLMGPVKECIEIYNDHWSQLRDVLYEMDGPDDPNYLMLVEHTGEKSYGDTLNALDQNDITLFEGFSFLIIGTILIIWKHTMARTLNLRP